ncbi:MAG: cadmium-translocating P-type ATPase [Oscillospiraceae bacterium]|jgi:Cd2+/Zn2+-exporting ATPase|nr:cadmium-translocating P-type ATPase [Oscillospiraceae bacterium]
MKKHERVQGDSVACGAGDCCCGHENTRGAEAKRAWLPWAALGLAIACAGLLFVPIWSAPLQFALALASALLAGARNAWNALRALLHRKITDGLLMFIAVTVCFILGDFHEAAAIACFMALGEQLEDLATRRSRKTIAALAEIAPDTASVRGMDGALRTVPASGIGVGATVVVPPFTRVALDCVVLQGESTMDTSAITGESIPREIGKGDRLLSGFINGGGTLTAQTTARSADSAAARVLAMVEDAAKNKGSGERFMNRFAKIYVPVLLGLGAAVALVPSVITGDWTIWVPRGLAVLISGCPCAIVLSVPLSFFAAIGGAARRGVLVKGGRFVEAMSRVTVAAFDKTGTLTTGRVRVAEVFPVGGWRAEDLLEYAAAAEQYTTHPLGAAIREAGGPIALDALEEVHETPANGVEAVYRDWKVLCGGRRLMIERGVDLTGLGEGDICVAVNGKLAGTLRMETELHPDAPAALAALRKLGIRRLVMLTGDTNAAAQSIAQSCGIDEFQANLLPEDKLAALQKLKDEGNEVLFVGDGINDAPALALADVGVAMGAGAQAAGEAADILLMGDSLGPLAKARRHFQASQNVIRANIAFALLVKGAVIGLNMVFPGFLWLAVFADVGVMVLTVLNAMRLAMKPRV